MGDVGEEFGARAERELVKFDARGFGGVVSGEIVGCGV